MKLRLLSILLLFVASVGVLVWLYDGKAFTPPKHSRSSWHEIIVDLEACGRLKHLKARQYKHFAEIAAAEKRPDAERLFRAIAFSEQLQEQNCASAIRRRKLYPTAGDRTLRRSDRSQSGAVPRDRAISFRQTVGCRDPTRPVPRKPVRRTIADLGCRNGSARDFSARTPYGIRNGEFCRMSGLRESLLNESPRPLLSALSHSRRGVCPFRKGDSRGSPQRSDDPSMTTGVPEGTKRVKSPIAVRSWTG